jgi:hypothetical protein
MLVSTPIEKVDYFLTTINGVKYEIPPMGLNMLEIDLESLLPGVHGIQVTPYVEGIPAPTIVFELVIEKRKTGTAYILMVNEAYKKYFQEPTTLFVRNGEDGGSGGGGGCFISAAGSG